MDALLACTIYISGIIESQKKALKKLELEL